MPGPHRSINIAGGGAPKRRKTAGGYRGDWGCTMADQPPDDGPGNRRQTPLDNRSTSQENGCAKHRALAPWPTCQNADVECDGKTRSPTGPQTPRTGNPRPAVRHGLTVGQNFSALSCSLLRQTEWPHLHCRADAVVELRL